MNIADIIAKDAEDITDDEFEALLVAIDNARAHLDTLQEAHRRLTGVRRK